jgi:hypothetical protein
MHQLKEQIEVSHVLYGLIRHMREAESGIRQTPFGERQTLITVESMLRHSRHSESTQNQWADCRCFFLPFSATSFAGFCAAIAEFYCRQAPYVSEDLLLIGMLGTETPVASVVLESLRLSLAEITQLLLPPPTRPALGKAVTTMQAISSSSKQMAEWLCGYTAGVSDQTRFVPSSKCFDEDAVRVLLRAAISAQTRQSKHIDNTDICISISSYLNHLQSNLFHLFREYRCLSVATLNQISRQSKRAIQIRIGDYWYSHTAELALRWAITLAGSMALPAVTVDWLLLSILEVDSVCPSPCFAIPHTLLGDIRLALSSAAHKDPLELPSMPNDRPAFFFPNELADLVYGYKEPVIRFLNFNFLFSLFGYDCYCRFGS